MKVTWDAVDASTWDAHHVRTGAALQQDWAYGACIWLGLRSRRSWRDERAWSLGRWSRPVAVVAVAWVVLITPVLLWPVEVYNPAGLVTALAFLAFLAAAWWLRARARFRGPAHLASAAMLDAAALAIPAATVAPPATTDLPGGAA